MEESISQAWEREGGTLLSAWSDSCDADPRWQHSCMFGVSSSCLNLGQRHSQGGELVRRESRLGTGHDQAGQKTDPSPPLEECNGIDWGAEAGPKSFGGWGY